jgi:hypothetical protein
MTIGRWDQSAYAASGDRAPFLKMLARVRAELSLFCAVEVKRIKEKSPVMPYYEYLLDEPGLIDDQVKAARYGDSDADLRLRWLAASFLEQRKEWPNVLCEYFIEVLRRPRDESMVRKKRGPNNPHRVMLKTCITLAVAWAVSYGYAATRSRARNPKVISACCLVERVLGDLGIHMSERAMRIFGSRAHEPACVRALIRWQRRNY